MLEPLWVRFRLSARYVACVLVVHLGGCACVAISNYPTPLAFLTCAVLLFSLAATFAGIPGGPGKRAVTGLRRLSDGRWQLVGRTGGGEIVALRNIFSSPLFVVLFLRDRRSRYRSLVIVADMLNPEQFRRLRVALWLAPSVRIEDSILS